MVCSLGCNDTNEQDRYDYEYPVFNPNNGEEFAYLRRDNHEPGFRSEVWIMNGRTGETRMIADQALSYLDWSPYDELLFMGLDRHVYKIKSNGDSLKQITFEGDWNRYPYWTHTGNTFTINRQIGSDEYSLLISRSGEIIDSIEHNSLVPNPRGHSALNFIAESRMRDNMFSVGYFDENRNFVSAYSELISDNLDHLYYTRGLTWQNQESVLWATKRFIGTTNIITYEHHLILETSDAQQSFKIGINPNGTHALLQTVTQELIETCTIDRQYKLQLLDLESGELRSINPPE